MEESIKETNEIKAAAAPKKTAAKKPAAKKPTAKKAAKPAKDAENQEKRWGKDDSQAP